MRRILKATTCLDCWYSEAKTGHYYRTDRDRESDRYVPVDGGTPEHRRWRAQLEAKAFEAAMCGVVLRTVWVLV